MTFKKLIIEYGEDFLPVEYNLLDYPIVQRWAKKIIAAQSFPYQIDDPRRFYGFNSVEQEKKYAINNINLICQKLVSLGFKIDRKLTDVGDQDTLNFLHNIFEKHHGLLNHAKDINDEVFKNLCNLNIAVHRCESIQRGSKPRHVVTYFGLPKTDYLEIADYHHFTNKYTFGTVYLNYAEIGKTLEDLSLDNDNYISEEAFRPFKYFSADFNVKFFNTSDNELQELNRTIENYFNKNKLFFDKHDLPFDSPFLKSGSIPLAVLHSTIKLKDIKTRQCVKTVNLYE
jgi:hypothetical protein